MDELCYSLKIEKESVILKCDFSFLFNNKIGHQDMMQGKTVLITGATSGIGLETARKLLNSGAKIVITTRDIEKGRLICERLISSTGRQEIYPIFCRLDSFQSIADFAEIYKKDHQTLDVLINNAGVWETSRKESLDGIELTFAVNHLAPFLLTNLLLPALSKPVSSRIINVASGAHKGATINFADIENKNGYHWMKPYSQTKLANILFTRMLANKLRHTKFTVNCLHPGIVSTSIFRNMNPLVKVPFRLYMISPEKGAENSVYLASSQEVEKISGEYFVKKRIDLGSSDSRDMEMAKKLWEISTIFTRKYIQPWIIHDK